MELYSQYLQTKIGLKQNWSSVGKLVCNFLGMVSLDTVLLYPGLQNAYHWKDLLFMDPPPSTKVISSSMLNLLTSKLHQ